VQRKPKGQVKAAQAVLEVDVKRWTERVAQPLSLLDAFRGLFERSVVEQRHDGFIGGELIELLDRCTEPKLPPF